MSDSTPTPTIQFEQQGSGEAANYQLVNDGFRNEMFDDNLAFLQSAQPAIYDIIKSHLCRDYRLCINPDGSPNVLQVAAQKLLYYAEGPMNINGARAMLEKLPFDMDISPTYALQYKPDWHQRNPLSTRMYQALYDVGSISQLVDETNRTNFNQNFNPRFIPYLRIYGVGLGYHLSQLIQSRDVLSLLIYEPEIDLFYCSLFITPWRLIFEYMQMDPARRLSLIVGQKAEQAIEQEKSFLAAHYPFIQNTRWQLSMFSTAEIQRFIALEYQHYRVSSDGLTAGWYEDQRAGLVNALGNIIAARKVFTGKRIKDFLRVAIVGAGPSLDDSIAYLKQHTDDFIIFACGTAITSLLKNDIVPDYHVHQERRSDAEAVISWAGVDSYKNITALKLNVLDAEVDDLYREAFIFQKYNDPASALLEDSFPVTQHVNPTVTNSAIAFASELGANEVYLLGVDYGAPSDTERMHATHYIHAQRATEKVDVNSQFKLDGNFGKTIISTEKLVFSRNIAEIAIQNQPGIKWFNVGDGALIKGTKPIATTKLPVRYKKHLNKLSLQQQIASCFSNNYSASHVIEQLESQHGHSVNEYILAMRNFVDVPVGSRSAVASTLAAMYQAADIGKDLNNFMPHKLFSGAIKLFIDDVNIQHALFDNDADALVFYAQATQILATYLDEMLTETQQVIRNAREQLEQHNQRAT